MLSDALQFMYDSVKAFIRCEQGTTNYIDSNTGLKQGCLASPIMFTFYIELVKTFKQDNVS